jgi:folate-binding protein YgfZ
MALSPNHDPTGPREGHTAALDGVLVLPLPDSVPVRVHGPDRRDFLHGQLTSDVRTLAEGGWQRTLQLDHKGHVLASALLYARADDLYLDVEAGGDELVASLRRHVVFDQVTIEDLRDTLSSVALVGRGVPALLASLELGAPGADTHVTGVLGGASVLLGPALWSPVSAVTIHLLERDRSAIGAALAGAGAGPGPASLVDGFRIEAGYATAADAGSGVLPQEIGLEGAVSYRKGCYLGQEIMARIEARGKLRRAPARLTLTSLPAGDDRDIVLDGRRVGRLGRTAAEGGRVRALAALRTDLAPGVRPSVGGSEVAEFELL